MRLKSTHVATSCNFSSEILALIIGHVAKCGCVCVCVLAINNGREYGWKKAVNSMSSSQLSQHYHQRTMSPAPSSLGDF